jgi:hypothetical protein
MSRKGPRHPLIPPEVEWCRGAMCWLHLKASAVTPKLFRNMGAVLHARIVREGVYERTGTMGGAVCGVLHVRDTCVESGQSCVGPYPTSTKHICLGFVSKP